MFGLITKKELQKQIDAIKAGNSKYASWLLQTSGAEKWNMPDTGVYANQAELYRKLSWVLTAVDMTAQAGALTSFNVGRLVAGKEPKDIPNHEFELLLSHPNELDSRFEFLYATIGFWKLNGNAYWWLNKAGESAPPDELWFIPPHKIKPLPDENLYLKGYLYDPGNGREIFLNPWEIIHFRRFNPFSRFTGLSAIEAIALVAQGDLGMQDWNTRLFKENNARLPGILTFAQMIEDGIWEKIKSDTREAAKNRELMMLKGVGQGDVHWMQNSVSQKEMEFLNGRKANKEEIFSVLAPGLMSMLSENATEANSLAGRATFNELTVYPMHVMMAEKITNEILPLYPGRPLVGHFEDIRISDRDMQLREQDEYSKTHTIEEVREKYYGDPPLDDERDNLLITQVTAQTGKPEVQPGDTIIDPATGQPISPNPDTTPPAPHMQQMDATAKAAIDDLLKYERKALKKIGKSVDFASETLPSDVLDAIRAELPKCLNESAVKAVFSKIRGQIAPIPISGAEILRGIELGLKALEMQHA